MSVGDTREEAAEDTASAARRRWLEVLAKAPAGDLERAWAALAEKPGYRFVRPPEVGTVMVRGRMGGEGRRFNAGEMTVSRCAVRLDAGPEVTGVGYVAGRSGRAAELIAVFDALLQDPARHDALEAEVVAPLEAAAAAERTARARKTAATRVDFFTMSRTR